MAGCPTTSARTARWAAITSTRASTATRWASPSWSIRCRWFGWPTAWSKYDDAVDRKDYARQSDDAGGVQQVPQGPQGRRHRPPQAAQRAPGRARHAAVRERDEHPLPDPGDAAHREDLRGGRHRAGNRGLCPVDAGWRQLEGHDDDRVSRRE